MRLKHFLSIFILATAFLFTACSNTKTEQTIFTGTSEIDNQSITVEILIEDKILKHIELIASDIPEVDVRSVYVFDDILNHSNANYDSYSKIDNSIFLAVEDAIANSGYTFDEISLIKPNTTTTSYTYDVVIVGAGAAGLTAAIEAKNLGYAEVVIIEKMSFAGGNTRMSNGCYAAPNNWVQEDEISLLDNADLFLEDLLAAGNYTGNEKLLSIIAENSLENAYWLRDEVGVVFQDSLTWYEGHIYTRALRIEKDGYGLVNALLEKATEVGVDFFYTTTAENLITNNDGAIIGVNAKKENQTLEFYSNTGVILATGGFGSNEEMLKDYNSEIYLENELKTTNSPAIIGDGIVMAEAVGTQLVDMNEVQLYPITNPATGNFYKLDYARLNDNAILVNINGERFINEHLTRDILSDAIVSQPKGEVYEILDPDTIKRTDIENLYPEEIAACEELGVLYKGTLKECAEYFGIPYENLKDTIDNYNSMSTTGVDTEYGRDGIKPIIDGEYIIFSAVSSIHHTMGGVKINEYSQVLDTNDEIIPGLYAAGEIVGGIYGENRLGASAIPESIIFSRIAAQNLAS